MTMINRIEPLERGKRKIVLEDGKSLVLYRKEARDLELAPDMELTAEAYQEILKNILIL